MYDYNMIMSLKQKERKFEPMIKLNHNIYKKKSLPPTGVIQSRLSVVSLGRLAPASFAVLTRKRREDHPGSVNETDVISGLVML